MIINFQSCIHTEWRSYFAFFLLNIYSNICSLCCCWYLKYFYLFSGYLAHVYNVFWLSLLWIFPSIELPYDSGIALWDIDPLSYYSNPCLSIFIKVIFTKSVFNLSLKYISFCTMTQTVLFLKYSLTRIKQIQQKDTQATISPRKVIPISQLNSITLSLPQNSLLLSSCYYFSSNCVYYILAAWSPFPLMPHLSLPHNPSDRSYCSEAWHLQNPVWGI